MLRNLVNILSALLIAAPVSAAAEGNPVVVELYTSQGCSSCPPADALMQELALNPGILPLAFHVDYWDYLGWRDALASPAFTKRQKDYAHAAGERMIYTPQAIVNGDDRMVGSDAQALMSAIMREMSVAALAEIRLARSGGDLTIIARASKPFDRPVEVLVLRFLPSTTVQILHGENAGKSITYVNTVTSLQHIATWTGRDALSLSTPVKGPEAVAVLVQGAGMGRVLAAASLP